MSNKKTRYLGDIEEIKRKFFAEGITTEEAAALAKEVIDIEKAVRERQFKGVRRLLGTFAGVGKRRKWWSVICADGIRRNKPLAIQTNKEIGQCNRYVALSGEVYQVQERNIAAERRIRLQGEIDLLNRNYKLPGWEEDQTERRPPLGHTAEDDNQGNT